MALMCIIGEVVITSRFTMWTVTSYTYPKHDTNTMINDASRIAAMFIVIGEQRELNENV